MIKTSPVALSFDSSAAGAGALSVVSFEGVERLSRPFRFDIDVVSGEPGAALDILIGQPASLAVGSGEERVIWRGVVTQVEEGLGHVAAGEVHRVTLEPRWALLDLVHGSRELHDLTVPEALLSVVAASGDGLAGDDVDLRLSREHPRRGRLAQQRESAMAFLSRLIEREGMVYCFTHQGPREVLVVTDDVRRHPAVRGGRVPFGQGPGSAVGVIASLRRNSRVAPRGEGPSRERGGVRLFRGEGTSPALHAGHRFSVDGHPRADFSCELLITQVHHRGHAQRGYDNTFEALASADLLRPEPAAGPDATAHDSMAPAPEPPPASALDSMAPAPDSAAATAYHSAAPAPEPPPGQASSVWRVGHPGPRVPGALTDGPRPLAQQQHLAVDDTQNARLDAVEAKNTQQDAKDAQLDAKNTSQDQDIDAVEAKNAQQDVKLAALDASTQNTWLRFNVPYGTDLTSYLRLGAAPTEGTDIETPLKSKLSLNTGNLDGHFEYTTGNRTIITGGDKEEIVDGKHRIAINSGGLGLFDADPIYFLDFSQDVTGAWRKSEFTHVSATQFAIGDSSNWMMGVTGGYFLGIKVDVFASLAMTIGLGINYNHVKGFSFQEAKAHDFKARDRVTIRVKTADPFFTRKNTAIVGAAILAGGAAAIALAAANGRSDMGRATAAFGTTPTVGLATAASIAAVFDVYKRVMRKTAGDRLDNDSVITVTANHIDLKSGASNTSILVNGQNDQLFLSVDNGSSFVMIDGPAGGDTVYLVSQGTIRLNAPTIEMHGAINMHGNVHMFNDLQVDGNLNGAPFVVAPPAPPPPPAPVAPPPMGILARVGAFLRLW